jgi:hypothetical protein
MDIISYNNETLGPTIEDKKINIVGICNRYKVKKATYNLIHNKERIDIKKNNFPDDYFIYEKQLCILNDMYTNFPIINSTYKNISRQIEKKIASYKQQDIDKNRLDEDKFINLNLIISKLIECNLTCYYCFCKMSLLYKIVREIKQWTLDRINNNYGHNSDNVVLSCLECNLKKRCTSTNNFLFTKQLKITRIDT